MGFHPDIYHERRNRLAQKMTEGVAILATGGGKVRNSDVNYPFRPDSSFYYLCGFPEPDAILVITASPRSARRWPEPWRRATEGFGEARENPKTVLFCRDKDPKLEVWTGRRFGQDGAKDKFGFDDAYSVKDLDQKMLELLSGEKNVYVNLGSDHAWNIRVLDWINGSQAKRGSVFHTIRALASLVDEMRLIKDPEEIAIIQHAANISRSAHVRAMRACFPGMMEYQLEAELQHEFHSQGGDRLNAYPSIVAGGVNACVLHYVENDCELKDGDLVLIDAGCEYQGYASDITRTFPVNGKFSPEQKALYELTLKAQLSAISEVKPGKTIRDPHYAAVKVITEGLVSLEILSGDIEDLIKKEAYLPFMIHGTSHYLGADVHDAGNYMTGKSWRVLEPGMVLTVEPGIYISPETKDVDPKWLGIGIRIEDDVLVTADSHRVLTAQVPKTIEEIEEIMRK